MLELVTTTKRMQAGDKDEDQFVKDQVHNKDWVNKDWVIDDLMDDKDRVGNKGNDVPVPATTTKRMQAGNKGKEQFVKDQVVKSHELLMG